MEKAIIIGTEKIFLERRAWIEENYKIIYLVARERPNRVLEYPFIETLRLKSLNISFDKIIICSDYIQEIKQQLEDMGFSDDIITYKDLDKIRDKRKYSLDKLKYIDMYEKEPHIGKFQFSEKCERPFVSDYRQNNGALDAHYFLQDMIVAKLISKKNVQMHYDIGSRVDGFISHLMCMDIKTTLIDIRPMNYNIKSKILDIPKFVQSDATELKNIEDNSIKSLSSLHAVEHFGLGRYGDEIDCNAWYKCAKNIQRVLAEEGYLYFSVPIGSEERLHFNAHRVFNPATVLATFDELLLEKLIIIHDYCENEYLLDEVKNKKYIECLGDFDCGIFVFRKLVQRR